MNASPAPVVSTTLKLNGGIWPVLVLVGSKAPSEPIVTATVCEPRFEEFLGHFLVVGFAGEFMGTGVSRSCEASVWKVLRGSEVTGKSSADLSRRELGADAGEQVDRAIAIGIDWNPLRVDRSPGTTSMPERSRPSSAEALVMRRPDSSSLTRPSQPSVTHANWVFGVRVSLNGIITKMVFLLLSGALSSRMLLGGDQCRLPEELNGNCGSELNR
jgi:hypothetical protein